VQEAQQQCDTQKEEVKVQQQQACNVQVEKIDASLKDAQREVEDANAKVVAIETRVTKEKDDAIADAQNKLDSLKEACTQEVRTAKQEANQEGEDRLNKAKAAAREKLQDQTALTAKCLEDSRVNAANKEAACKKQEDDLNKQIFAKGDEYAALNGQYLELRNQYAQLAQQVKDQIMAAKAAREQSAAALQIPEAEVASPALLATSVLNSSSTALCVYTSLILSALFLCGLIFKLRGHLAKHKNYSAVMADA
jgi:chromosome segregation ATPase